MKNEELNYKNFSIEEWKENIINEIKKSENKSFDDLIWDTNENFRLGPIYNQKSSKFKGKTHNHSDWKIEEKFKNITNKEILESLESGTNAILLLFPKISDLKNIFNDVYINLINTSFKSDNLNELTNEFLTILRKKQINPKIVSGSLKYDPLMDCLINDSIENNIWKKIKNTLEYSSDLKLFKSITIEGENYLNFGANIIQEVSFIFSELIEYFTNIPKLDANKIQINIGISTNYFFEIAKFRAIRIIWLNILKIFKKKKVKLNLRAETSLRTFTIFSQYSNILRSTSQCMSAIIGGSDIICINSCNYYDQSDLFSKRISKNIQFILQEEAYFGKVIDPGSGSYYIEYLTDFICKEVWKKIRIIEKKDGWLKSVQKRIIQKEIEKNSLKQNKLFEQNKINLIGTNIYPDLNENISAINKKKLEDSINNINNKSNSLNYKRLSENIEKLRITNLSKK